MTVNAFDTLGQQVATIADRVERLGQSRRTPEEFHCEKSDIVKDARSIARKLDGGSVAPRREHSTSWRAPAGYRDV